jgi:hypothetical protein
MKYGVEVWSDENFFGKPKMRWGRVKPAGPVPPTEWATREEAEQAARKFRKTRIVEIEEEKPKSADGQSETAALRS